ADLRVAPQNGLNVHDRHALDRKHRNALDGIQEWLDFRRNFGLQRPHDNILSAFLPPPALVEHAKRFSDSRRVAEKDLQAAGSGGWTCFTVGHDQGIVTLSAPSGWLEKRGRRTTAHTPRKQTVVNDS